MTSVLSSIFFFMLAIGLLVTVHEFGHFWVARRLGVRVLKFSIGFGKPLWKWRRKNDETEYVIAAIPLGGYVQMLDEREGPVASDQLSFAFNRKPIGSRIAIVAAGPLFNFLLAIVAYWLIFIIGISGMKPIIGDVRHDSIAEQGGFRSGDIIVSINQEPVATWNSALLALLDESLGQKVIEVEVEDESQSARTRQLDLGTISETIGRNDLLESIGLIPYRPKIPAIIGQLEPGGVAEAAGMQAGDRIVSVDDTTIADWREWVDYVKSHPEQPMHVMLERDGAEMPLMLTPARVHTEQGDSGRIGAVVEFSGDITESLRATERYSPLAALAVAIEKTWDMSLLTLRMLGNMLTGNVSVSNLSGPISIAQYAGYSAGIGFVSFVGFLALISISLGVLNLLPVPILDGGHLMYYLIELVKGSPVSEDVQVLGQRIGIAILGVVMILAFYNDIDRLFG